MIAALEGTLDQLPREWLTRANLTWTNYIGSTPLHNAAMNGHLDQVPRAHLHWGNLGVKDDIGATFVHTAAARGHLDQVPRELLLDEVAMGLTNDFGDTPVTLAAKQGCLEQIPWELFRNLRFRNMVRRVGKELPADAQRKLAAEQKSGPSDP